MMKSRLAAAAVAMVLALPTAALAQHHHGGWGGGWGGGGGGWGHGGGHGWVGPAIGLGVLGGALAAPYAYRYYEPAPVYEAPARCWYPQWQAYYACGY